MTEFDDTLQRLARSADKFGQGDDQIAFDLWDRMGIDCLEALLAQPLTLGKTEQTIGLDLTEHWDVAVPQLASALARGGNRLVLRLLYYLDADHSAEVIVRCGAPSLKFPDADLAAWCRTLGSGDHPEALGMLARLRHHRSRQVQIAATAHDAEYCTAERAIALLDEFSPDAPIAHIAELEARRDDVLVTAEVQAAVVRLLDRRRAELAGQTIGFYDLLGLIRGPATAPLLDWIRTNRDDPTLHFAIAEILAQTETNDLELLQWLANNADPDPARHAREQLVRAGQRLGRFIDISGRNAELCPDVVDLRLVEVDGTESRARAIIEIAFAAPPQLGVTFDHAGTTWCACLNVRSNRDGYHPNYMWSEVAPLADATGRLAEVASAHQARLVDDVDAARGPEVLRRAVDRLSAAGDGLRAITVSLRLHDAIDLLQPLVRPHVHWNTLRAAQLQLFDVTMTARRYADAVIVGKVVGPLPHARALAAAGRHADALEVLGGIGRRPEVIGLERTCRDEIERRKKRLAIGVAVSHPKFGAGTVTAVAGEGASQKATIQFSSGERTLAASFVTLT